MDIRVGKAPEIGAPADRTASPGGVVEARLLAIRAPRRNRGTPPAGGRERRSQGKDRDPVNGRVLVLLIPDKSMLPQGLEAGQYRVFIRFARR